MAKYDVNFSCGHTYMIELFGKSEDRKKKIEWFEKCGVCPDCLKEQKEIEKSIGCKEVEMSYREYKTDYADCKTKAGSYNGTKKTIVVYTKLQYDQISIHIPKGKKDKYRAIAELAGKRLEQFVIDCIEEKIEKNK